jgi:plastocyanin
MESSKRCRICSTSWMPGRRHAPAAILSLVATIFLGGCGGGGSSSAATPLLPGEVGVLARNLAFTPQHVTAKVGQNVVWQFSDTVAHNVSGDGFKSKDLTKGVYKHAFTQAGKYSYKCTIHPTMTGDVTVQ